MADLVDQVNLKTSEALAVERRLKITVLSGGPSAERDVSFKSGQAVAEALRSVGHDVVVADISPQDLGALDAEADLVFIALHGTFGEDGQLQQILDRRGIRYCGSGASASALAMDKAASKACFIAAGIPTAEFDVVTAENLSAIRKKWSAPAVIKPVAEGSSVDLYIAEDEAQFDRAMEEMADKYDSFMVERFVTGPELTVGVLGDEALPPIQIRPASGRYDYHAKYFATDTEYLFEIHLPAELLNEVRRLSVEAHRALGCRDFSRIDWIVDERTSKPHALEANTIPGFTDHSLLPKAAARSGLDFATLCQRIVELTCRR